MLTIIYLASLLILLLLLYLFHQQIVKYFSLVSFLLFGNGKIGIYFYFLFFLPGVILHELSHLFMASVLGVPTGNLSIFPRQEGEDLPAGRRGWSLGKVSSAETDPLRGNLIGLAPILVGALSLVVINNLIFGKAFSHPELISGSLLLEMLKQVQHDGFWQTVFYLYLVLTFANTMFLSREDRTSIWAFPSLLVVLFFLFQAMGWVGILMTVENFILEIVRPLILSFGLTVLVDFIFILPLVFLARLLLRFRQ